MKKAAYFPNFHSGFYPTPDKSSMPWCIEQVSNEPLPGKGKPCNRLYIVWKIWEIFPKLEA